MKSIALMMLASSTGAEALSRSTWFSPLSAIKYPTNIFGKSKDECKPVLNKVGDTSDAVVLSEHGEQFVQQVIVFDNNSYTLACKEDVREWNTFKNKMAEFILRNLFGIDTSKEDNQAYLKQHVLKKIAAQLKSDSVDLRELFDVSITERDLHYHSKENKADYDECVEFEKSVKDWVHLGMAGFFATYYE